MGTDGELLSRVRDPEGHKDEKVRLRNITIGNEQTLWKVFCILPNVDGQKYTLGKSFTSGEDQGEFVFLSKNQTQQNLWPIMESNLCEVQVVNEKYFVRPLDKTGRRSRAVFLNDAQISKRTEIRFGDYLSLDDQSQTFLFAERIYSDELSNNGSEATGDNFEDNGVEFVPGQNELIMTHIFSYLPVKVVKGLRHVASLWNQAAMPIIRKRCKVVFNFDDGNYNTLTSMKFFMYNVEMKDNPITNLAIDFPSCQNFYLGGDNFDAFPGAGAKFLEDFDMFLSQPFVQNIKKLEVGGSLVIKLEFDLRIQLFQAVQPTLEELIISGEWYLPLKEEKDCVFPDTITFPKLRSFTLSWMDIEISEDEISLINWFKNIVHGITRVASVHLDSQPTPIRLFLEQLRQVSNSFPNLKELTSFDLNPKIIKKLLQLKLSKPLKILALENTYDFEFKTKKDFGVFEQLLEKCAPALEKLTLAIPPSSRNPRGVLPSRVSLPAFPNLKYLEMSWEHDYFETQGLELVFPGGFINYEKDFPSLKSLVFRHKSSRCEDKRTRHCRKIYEGFLPPTRKGFQTDQAQICSTIQVLDIWGPIREKEVLDKQVLYFTKSVIVAINAMFPQASNYDWLKVLERYGIVHGPQND